jgi:predicted ATP-grasp superfamily ATP-dependent carboligase
VGALVLGGDYKVLGIVRSLGRHRIPVWVLEDEHLLARWSRYAVRTLPWQGLSEPAQVERLLELGRRHRLDGWMLVPASDESAALIARNHDALGEMYGMTVPRWDVFRWAYDKRLTYGLAATVGVDHPRTSYPRSREDVLRFDGGYPAILKPAIRPLANRFTMAKAWRVEDRSDLLARYDDACSLVDPASIMIQELIPGGGESQLSYAALCRNGRPLASVVVRRTRQWPMDFGRASTYVESIDDPDVERSARRLLDALGLDGLAEVEFKRDPRDGRLKLLDVNPRVWGWHTLGSRVGVDFAYLLWRMTNGAPVPQRQGRPGVRWVRALTDVPTVIGEIRAGRLSVRDYVASLRGPIELAVLALDDPLPALMEVPAAIYLAWTRRGLMNGAPHPAADSAVAAEHGCAR